MARAQVRVSCTLIAQELSSRVVESFTTSAGIEVQQAPFRAIQCESGLPADAILVACWVNPLRGEVVFTFQSPAFPPPDESGLLPVVKPMFRSQSPAYCGWGHECAECAKARV